MRPGCRNVGQGSRRCHRRPLGWAGQPSAAATPAAAPAAIPLATAPVQSAPGSVAGGYDGVVEAVRQTVVAAQVAGAVTAIEVKAGDSVKAGQLLMRIDARVAEQTALASEAQIASAQALPSRGARDYERQQQLFQQKFISQAALDQAESTTKASQAQGDRAARQASATRSQSVLRRPRALHRHRRRRAGRAGRHGDAGQAAAHAVRARRMRASPRCRESRCPTACRAPGRVPERCPPSGAAPVQPVLLPTVDAGTPPCSCASRCRRASPASRRACSRGSGCRRARGGDQRTAVVPAAAVLRRGEMTGVYVVDDTRARPACATCVGRPRAPRRDPAGVSAGERVAVDPQAAAGSVEGES